MRFLIVSFLFAAAFAAADPKDKAAPPPPPPDPAKSFSYKQGKVVLKDGLATLLVPKEFRYLDPEDSKRLIEDGWGNPPGSGAGTLGMILPSDIEPLGPDSWGVIVTYDEDGFVKDEDADKIDYNKLLKEMQESTAESNKEREKSGYGSIALVGWASPPRYDKAGHKLYWAKELKFSDSKENTLNYNIRVLGRKGVLVLNAVASKSQLALVEKAMVPVMNFVEFNPGSRYMDFIPGTDNVAAYGIGALVAGKVAAKAGLFKVLVAALLASKKLIVAGVIGLGALLSRLFGRKKDEEPLTVEDTTVTEQAKAASADGDNNPPA